MFRFLIRAAIFYTIWQVIYDLFLLPNGKLDEFLSLSVVYISETILNIFDLTGRQVASLINEFMIPGNHQISWNPGLLPSGVYLVELVAGDRSFNQKITYIK